MTTNRERAEDMLYRYNFDRNVEVVAHLLQRIDELEVEVKKGMAQYLRADRLELKRQALEADIAVFNDILIREENKVKELEREKEALLIHANEFETSWRELNVKVKELEAENARLKVGKVQENRVVSVEELGKIIEKYEDILSDGFNYYSIDGVNILATAIHKAVYGAQEKGER